MSLQEQRPTTASGREPYVLAGRLQCEQANVLPPNTKMARRGLTHGSLFPWPRQDACSSGHDRPAEIAYGPDAWSA